MVSINPKVIGLQPNLQVWSTIGGGVKENETSLETAKRELYEETGLITISLKGPVYEGEYPAVYKGNDIISVESFFTATVKNQDIDKITIQNWTIDEKKNLKGMRWVPVDEINNPHPLTRFLPSNLSSIIKSCE